MRHLSQILHWRARFRLFIFHYLSTLLLRDFGLLESGRADKTHVCRSSPTFLVSLLALLRLDLRLDLAHGQPSTVPQRRCGERGHGSRCGLCVTTRT